MPENDVSVITEIIIDHHQISDLTVDKDRQFLLTAETVACKPRTRQLQNGYDRIGVGVGFSAKEEKRRK